MQCVWGEGEGFAVPVEGSELVGEEGCEGVCGVGGGVLDREPADFLAAARGDFCAKDFGDEPGSEADAESGYTGQDGFTDEVFFRGEPGVGLGIVHTHGAAQYDPALDSVQVGKVW